MHDKTPGRAASGGRRRAPIAGRRANARRSKTPVQPTIDAIAVMPMKIGREIRKKDRIVGPASRHMELNFRPCKERAALHQQNVEWRACFRRAHEARIQQRSKSKIRQKGKDEVGPFGRRKDGQGGSKLVGIHRAEGDGGNCGGPGAGRTRPGIDDGGHIASEAHQNAHEIPATQANPANKGMESGTNRVKKSACFVDAQHCRV